LKKKKILDFNLWGVIAEFGTNLGWRYIFWDAVDGIFSPIPKNRLAIDFPPNMKFIKIHPPVPDAFYQLSMKKGNKNKVVLSSGNWGWGPIYRITKLLSQAFPQLNIFVLCGENTTIYQKLLKAYRNKNNICIQKSVDSLIPILRECGSIITKPGISTLIEAHAAQRKIFLLKGIPVSEDNNALYGIKNFDAEWFSVPTFRLWYESESF
jgi:UDP-N-acetylglucosamine:LPS N-acetylglucosamine transferase